MTNTEKKMISTTALSKKFKISTKEMFAQLCQLNLIEKRDDLWCLTDDGIKRGGRFVESKKFGKYITWPEDLKLEDTVGKEKLITATTIGKQFSLSAVKINHIFSELGWQRKYIKGWRITIQGKKQGGLQDANIKSGVPFVRWPVSILESRILISSVEDFKGTKNEIPEKNENGNKKNTEENNFREKFPAKHRATDGHLVRSKAEMLIDNWLYMAEIVHAYERKLPIQETVYSDFYIPAGKVYIEFWGYDNDKKYLARKKAKQEIYKNNDLHLIELVDKDVLNLDDVLPGLLLNYGVQAY